ncbi:MAG: hypothetical protein PHP97_02875 [Candidatus Shapirobacteria bacterium]|nr:hypothetical protein [Candidatus Shapirobacteria bacterium]MDD3002989.1 hypothetical protein [Candidatus Shapirobacteria bacterium]MDD4383143.1 hypothetical protein [Candidatus Shapirobacteria bacterium]
MENQNHTEEQLVIAEEISRKFEIPLIDVLDALNFLPECSSETVEDAMSEYYKNALDCPQKRAALYKWNKLIIGLANAATTCEEIAIILSKTPPKRSKVDSESQKITINKIYELYLNSK